MIDCPETLFLPQRSALIVESFIGFALLWLFRGSAPDPDQVWVGLA